LCLNLPFHPSFLVVASTLVLATFTGRKGKTEEPSEKCSKSEESVEQKTASQLVKSTSQFVFTRAASVENYSVPAAPAAMTGEENEESSEKDKKKKSFWQRLMCCKKQKRKERPSIEADPDEEEEERGGAEEEPTTICGRRRKSTQKRSCNTNTILILIWLCSAEIVANYRTAHAKR
jgi:hypothetical protein